MHRKSTIVLGTISQKQFLHPNMAVNRIIYENELYVSDTFKEGMVCD